MSNPPPEIIGAIVLATEVDQLRTDFITAVSILGAVSLLLLCLVIGLYIWNVILTKKIKEKNLLLPFKLARPQVEHTTQRPITPPHDYDNLAFDGQKLALNPIANRTKTNMDPGNFSFSSPDPALNSFRSQEYLNRDSRFY